MSKSWFDQITEGVAGLAPHARALVEAIDELSKTDFKLPESEELTAAKAEIGRLQSELTALRFRHEKLNDFLFRFSQDLSERVTWERTFDNLGDV